MYATENHIAEARMGIINFKQTASQIILEFQ